MLRKLLERSPMEGSERHLERGGILMKKMLSVAGVLLAGVVFTGTVQAAEPVSSGEMDAEFGELVELVGVEGHCELSASKTAGVVGGLSIGKLCSETIRAYETTRQKAQDALAAYEDALEERDPAAAEAAARTLVAALEELEDMQGLYNICRELLSLTLGH